MKNIFLLILCSLLFSCGQEIVSTSEKEAEKEVTMESLVISSEFDFSTSYNLQIDIDPEELTEDGDIQICLKDDSSNCLLEGPISTSGLNYNLLVANAGVELMAIIKTKSGQTLEYSWSYEKGLDNQIFKVR